MSVTQNLLQKAKAARELSQQKDDSWIDRLYAWADENHCHGLPRDREKLFNFTELELVLPFGLHNSNSLPAEIGKLTNLEWLELKDEHLSLLPQKFYERNSTHISDLTPHLCSPFEID